MQMDLTPADWAMLKRIMSNGIFVLDRTNKIISKDRTVTAEIPKELFDQVKNILQQSGYQLIDRDSHKLEDITGGAISRMLEV